MTAADHVSDPAVAQSRGARLRALHEPANWPLILPNVWDAVSARAFAATGFAALATSSSAVAASLGYADGERTPREEMFAAVARIARSVDVPVTADIEAGYGLPAGELAGRLVAAGAAGCNLEDSDPRSHALAAADAAAQRIAALRAAAGDALVINARIDLFLPARREGDPDAAVAEAIGRGRAYLAAGADCVYPILAPAAALAALVEEVGGPVNAMHVPGGPTLAELRALGVARITFGSGLLTRAKAEVDRLAAEVAAGAAASR